MPSFSFVHAADLHLGSPFSALSLNNPDLNAMAHSASADAFDNLIDLCLKKAVDFLLVAGDVFDGEDRSLGAQVKFRDGLRRLSDGGIRAFVVHGNHDPLSAWSATLDWPERVHIIGDKLETVQVERDASVLACIQGISYSKRDERSNLSLLFKRTGPAFHIGLLHANVGSDTGHEPYAPCSMEDLARSGMDYWALGHVHTRKVLSKESPWIVYSGNTQGRNARETGEKGCYLVRVGDHLDVEIEFHRTATLRWVLKDLPINHLASEQDLLNALDETCGAISSSGPEPALVRIVLAGRGPLDRSLRKPGALSDLLGILQEDALSYSPLVWVEQLQLRTGPELDLEALRQEKDFLGELLRCSGELVASVSLPENVSPPGSVSPPRDESFGDAVREELASLFDDPKARRFLAGVQDRELQDFLEQAEGLCAQNLQSEDVE